MSGCLTCARCSIREECVCKNSAECLRANKQEETKKRQNNGKIGLTKSTANNPTQQLHSLEMYLSGTTQSKKTPLVANVSDFSYHILNSAFFSKIKEIKPWK